MSEIIEGIPSFSLQEMRGLYTIIMFPLYGSTKWSPSNYLKFWRKRVPTQTGLLSSEKSCGCGCRSHTVEVNHTRGFV